MCFQKRDAKFKGHRGVLITTAALNKILEHENRKSFLFHTKINFCCCGLVFYIKVIGSDVLYIVMSVVLLFKLFSLDRFFYSPGNALCVGKRTNVGELLHHLSWFSKHWFCLYNFLSLLKLTLYSLFCLHFTKSRKGPISCKVSWASGFHRYQFFLSCVHSAGGGNVGTGCPCCW